MISFIFFFSWLKNFKQQTNIKTVPQKQYNPDLDGFKNKDGRLPDWIVKPA